MITIDGKEYRNLEEQVLKNMEDIKTLQEEQVDILNEDNTFTGTNTFKGSTTFNGPLYHPNTNGGGQLIVNNVMSGISYSDDGDQTGQVAVTSAGTSITGLVSPVNDNDAANKQYVDNAISDIDLSNYLPLSGGTMTGNVGFGTGLSINPPANPTTFNGIEVKGSVMFNDGLLYMNNKRVVSVAIPSADTDAANKKYVDDKVATIDTSSYVEKTTQINKAYGTNPDGSPKLWGVGDISVNYLVNRTAGGNVLLPAVSAITKGNYAASKAYVDSVATQGGSTYTVQVKSNHTNATITYCWKIGKMITFYGQFNDGLNGGSNFVNVASADTISHGYIQSGDNVMAFGNIHDNYATFDVEVGATTTGSAFNGRNFVGVIWLV